jgi:gas vesicle protein
MNQHYRQNLRNDKERVMSEGDSTSGLFSGFVVGAAVGLAIGFLYAPQAGQETRALVREKAEKTKEKAEEIIEEARERAKRIIADARGQAAEIREGKEESES